ncbi:MAG: hypothetical protein ACLFPQ_05080 [Candidatus Woesearchaeota archaeon]
MKTLLICLILFLVLFLATACSRSVFFTEISLEGTEENNDNNLSETNSHKETIEKENSPHLEHTAQEILL